MNKEYNYLAVFKVTDSELDQKKSELYALGYTMHAKRNDGVIMYRRGKFPWLAYILFTPLLGLLLIPFRWRLYDYYVKVEIVGSQVNSLMHHK